MSRTLPSYFDGITGKVSPDAALSGLTWLGVGGRADWLFEPEDDADLQRFLAQYNTNSPLHIIGAGSNMLVRDGGIDRGLIRLTGQFAEIQHQAGFIHAGAGASDGEVARFAAKQGRAGLSFMIGIPGTVGGGLRMNAGCYGSEFKDVLVSASGFDRQGKAFTATPDEMNMRYRASDAPQGWVFTSAKFATVEGDKDTLRAEMKSMIASRADAQPIGARTGGSTFANPDGHKAWQVIDAAGCRGLRKGGALLSEKHCNFLINEGQATAEDLEQLGEEVRDRVKQHSGIELRWEIRRIGKHPSDADEGEHHVL